VFVIEARLSPRSRRALLVQAGAVAAQNAVILRATLNGGEETPAAVLSGAVATAEVAVDSLSEEIAVQVRVFNLPTGSTASHIHIAPKGVTGPVVIDFPIGRPGIRQHSHNRLPWRRDPGTARRRRSRYSAVSSAVNRGL
jgi:CHRD domain